jgi:CelD/BcsL family acetyltransferase involved in cellulose biosynthesis
LRYSWLRRCWERQRTVHGTSLFIVALREGGRTVLIAPFVMRPCGFWRRELSFLDSLTPQYNDVLVVSGDCARYLDSLWRLLHTMPRIERFAANWVRDDSVLSPDLRDGASKQKAVLEAPFIDLTKFASWDEYQRSLSPSLQVDHRRQQRRLARAGAAFRASDDRSYSNDMAWLFAEKLNWLERTGAESKWLTAPGTERFFTAAVCDFMASGRLWLTTFAASGATIAACLCVREGETLYLSKIAYDRAWHSFSPARTLILLAIERAFHEGLKRCDLMIGADAWKQRLETGRVAVRNLRVKLGASG